MVTQEKEMYGSWCRIKGEVEEVADVIEEAKPLMLEHAQETMSERGLELDLDSVEWIVRQGYNDAAGTFFTEEPIEGGVPYVSLAWKGHAHG